MEIIALAPIKAIAAATYPVSPAILPCCPAGFGPYARGWKRRFDVLRNGP